MTKPVTEAWERSGLVAPPRPLQGILVPDFVAAAKQVGQMELVNNPAGQVGGVLTRIGPAREIVERIVQEAVDILTTQFGKEVLAST